MMNLVDKTILQRCLNGDDKKAYYELYKACYSYMMSIIIRYANGTGDEQWLLNICFSKIVLNLHKFDSTLSFKVWMKRVMINEILDELRKKKRQHKIKDSLINSTLTNSISYNRGEQNLNYQDLLALLNELPKRSKLVFNLFVLDGLSHDEIAKKLNMSDGTSKWHLSNARKSLQKMIENRKSSFTNPKYID